MDPLISAFQWIDSINSWSDGPTNKVLNVYQILLFYQFQFSFFAFIYNCYFNCLQLISILITFLNKTISDRKFRYDNTKKETIKKIFEVNLSIAY